ncbi:MAG: hypothetical protein WBB30_01765 [Solirubrobacterales bacterium]
MPEERASRVEDAVDGLAASSSRRGFLARVSAGMAALTAGGALTKLIKPGEADGFHFCGHIFTTDSCPHPFGKALPRIDRAGYPLRPSDGRMVDNLGRLVNGKGLPVSEDGEQLRDPDGRPLPPAPRTKLCDEGVSREFGFETWTDGSWYRCCSGQVRRLVDCCSYRDRRINGDAALQGYCFKGRKVFCVMYFDTKVPC